MRLLEVVLVPVVIVDLMEAHLAVDIREIVCQAINRCIHLVNLVERLLEMDKEPVMWILGIDVVNNVQVELLNR